MKKPTLVIFLITLLLFAAPVCAEIFKYLDENGKKRWTDDLSQVPKEQRPSAQRMETVEETTAETITEKAGKPQTGSPVGTKAAIPDTDESGETVELSRQALEKEKADLDTRYQQLLEERKQLEQIKPEALSFNDRAKLNIRISAYNGKTEQYDAQLNAFNKKIKAYNQKIMSKQSPQNE